MSFISSSCAPSPTSPPGGPGRATCTYLSIGPPKTTAPTFKTKIMDSLDEVSERDNQPSFEDLMAADDISPPRRTTPARSEVSRLPLFGSPHGALPLNNSPRFCASTYSSRRKDKDPQSGPEPLPKRATPKKSPVRSSPRKRSAADSTLKEDPKPAPSQATAAADVGPIVEPLSLFDVVATPEPEPMPEAAAADSIASSPRRRPLQELNDDSPAANTRSATQRRRSSASNASPTGLGSSGDGTEKVFFTLSSPSEKVAAAAAASAAAAPTAAPASVDRELDASFECGLARLDSTRQEEEPEPEQAPEEKEGEVPPPVWWETEAATPILLQGGRGARLAGGEEEEEVAAAARLEPRALLLGGEDKLEEEAAAAADMDADDAVDEDAGGVATDDDEPRVEELEEIKSASRGTRGGGGVLTRKEYRYTLEEEYPLEEFEAMRAQRRNLANEVGEAVEAAGSAPPSPPELKTDGSSGARLASGGARFDSPETPLWLRAAQVQLANTPMATHRESLDHEALPMEQLSPAAAAPNAVHDASAAPLHACNGGGWKPRAIGAAIVTTLFIAALCLGGSVGGSPAATSTPIAPSGPTAVSTMKAASSIAVEAEAPPAASLVIAEATPLSLAPLAAAPAPAIKQLARLEAPKLAPPRPMMGPPAPWRLEISLPAPELVPCSWTDLPAACTRRPIGLLMPPMPAKQPLQEAAKMAKAEPVAEPVEVKEVAEQDAAAAAVTAALPSANLQETPLTAAAAPRASEGQQPAAAPAIEATPDVNEAAAASAASASIEEEQGAPYGSSRSLAWLILVVLPAVAAVALMQYDKQRQAANAEAEPALEAQEDSEVNEEEEVEVKPASRRARATPTKAKAATPRKATLSKRGTLKMEAGPAHAGTPAAIAAHGTETAYKISASADGQVSLTPVRRTKRGKQAAASAAQSVLLLSPNNAISVVR